MQRLAHALNVPYLFCADAKDGKLKRFVQNNAPRCELADR